MLIKKKFRLHSHDCWIKGKLTSTDIFSDKHQFPSLNFSDLHDEKYQLISIDRSCYFVRFKSEFKQILTKKRKKNWKIEKQKNRETENRYEQLLLIRGIKWSRLMFILLVFIIIFRLGIRNFKTPSSVTKCSLGYFQINFSRIYQIHWIFKTQENYACYLS